MGEFPMRQAPILVVGAGPVGLTAAHRIARHGAAVRIIEIAEAPTTLSKALVVWRRTLQILDATLPRERFLAAGNEVRQARFFADGKLLHAISLQDEAHSLPPGVFIPQADTERLLIEALADQGVQVERETKLIAFEQDADGVTCQIEGPGGTEEFRASWLIGCDGAHSTVRHHLQLPFPGETVNRRWILADVEVDQETDPHEAIMEASKHGAVALFPVGTSRWRIIGDGGDVEPNTPQQDPTEEELQDILDTRTSRNWKIVKSYWRGVFHVNERQIENYVHGRVLLAGDAAHVHSPAGGQGMNTGIQDATNLAWKVALAWQGGADASLIETYQEERHPIGKEVVDATGRALHAISIKNPIARHLRNMALHFGLAIPKVREHVAEFLTEGSVNTRGSSLCGPGIRGAAVQPGDAMPDIAIDSSQGTIPATDLLRDAEAVCLVFGSVDISQLPDRLGSAEHGFPLAVRHLGNGGLTLDIEELATAFGLKDQGIVVVRPDGVILAVGEDVNAIAGSFLNRERSKV
ncbi:Rifampicin monooxygenase (RIFMO) [Durusdinium trenchii]|uniref:Rifampicin monooxygenase (RIFMO) n=1 Tax=Durusdinium trenchii TaxID=1381693 RepID=A0ABP0MMP7_9DINO